MEDAWSFGFSSSKSYQSVLKSLSDLCVDFEEAYEDEDLRADYPCPFCDDDFDLVELCCHIDEEHPYESRPGVCPVCASRVGADMVGHVISHHGHIVKSLHRLKLRKGESEPVLSFLKKDLQDDYLQSLFTNKVTSVTSKMAPDPLLSFVCSVSSSSKIDSVDSDGPLETTEEDKGSNENCERTFNLTDEQHMEKTRQSEFVQGLLMSTIFGDS